MIPAVPTDFEFNVDCCFLIIGLTSGGIAFNIPTIRISIINPIVDEEINPFNIFPMGKAPEV